MGFTAGSLSGAIDFGANVVRGTNQEFVSAYDRDGSSLWASGWLPRGCLMPMDSRGRLASSAGNDAPPTPRRPPRPLCAAEHQTAQGAADLAREPPVPEPVQQRRLAVVQKYPLEIADNGVDGFLQVLRDSRIGAFESDGCFGWDPLTGGLPGFDSPPRDSIARLVSSDGTVLATLASNAAYADVHPWALYGDDSVTYSFHRLRPVCRSRWTADTTAIAASSTRAAPP